MAKTFLPQEGRCITQIEEWARLNYVDIFTLLVKWVTNQTSQR